VGEENYVMKSLMISTTHQILFGYEERKGVYRVLVVKPEG
jgi:hypothetical protein